MRKILIADDEELIRKGLKAMLERYKKDYYDIHLCSNGREAKEVLSSENIDLVITDIRMPEFDGIELINYIKDSKKQTAIIILSGYDDFNYAKEAIRCGAKEYLLKPVNREKLYSCIEDIEKEIREKNEYIQAYYTNKLNYLIKGEILSRDMIEQIEKFANMNIFNEYYVALYSKNIDISPISEIDKNIYEKLIHFLDMEGNLVVITKEKNLLVEILKRNQHLKLVVGISKLHNSINNVKDAYIEAKEAFNHRILIENTMIYYDEVENRNKKIDIEIDKINSIANMLRTGRNDDINKNVDELFSNKYVNQYNVNYFIQLDKILKSKVIGIESGLYDYGSIYEYVKALKEEISKIEGELVNKDNNSTNLAMKKAVEYISTNYNKDISLAMVANEVNLNYTYFCELFKNYTGETYVTYVKKLRIAKSKVLLIENPHYKVYEIAKFVGYEDTRQFSKIFRKETGISPLEYKNKYYKN